MTDFRYICAFSCSYLDKTVVGILSKWQILLTHDDESQTSEQDSIEYTNTLLFRK